MPITSADVNTGVDDAISGILTRYEDGEEINDAIFNDLSGLGIDSDTESVLLTNANPAFWDEQFAQDPGDLVGNVMKDFALELAENGLEAQKNLSLTITNSVKAITSATVSIEQAVVEYIDGLPVKAYVEKVTGKVVLSETVLSETTHIPYGKVLAGTGKAIGVYSAYESFEDTIIAGYNAATTQETEAAFEAAKELLMAGAIVIGGATAGAYLGGPTLAGKAFATAFGSFAVEELIDAMPGLIADAKAASKTLQETLDDAYDAIKDKINDTWAATGQAAEDILNAGQAQLDDLLDGVKDLVPDLDLPPTQLPDWITDAVELFDDATDEASPLVLDLDGDGIELTDHDAATTTTFFDIDADSFAEQTAWVAPDDGLLAIDLNVNGTIDDASELFGTATVDGFAKLAELDSNDDLIINSNDTAWSSLRIWKDTNGDAVTQSGELHTLASLNISSIDLAGVAPSTATISGNPISHTSTYTLTSGTTRTVADAWFVHSNANTVYADGQTLDIRALFLPLIRGFGNVPDLHIAMSQDEDLLDMVEDFALNWTTDAFADQAALDSAIEDILFKWAGVDDVASNSRGPNIDARKLEFLEELFGEEWFNNQVHSSALLR